MRNITNRLCTPQQLPTYLLFSPLLKFFTFLFITFFTALQVYAQGPCANFPQPVLNYIRASRTAGSITITNLPAGAESSISRGFFSTGTDFVVGRTNYSVNFGGGDNLQKVIIRQNGCQTAKVVLVDPFPMVFSRPEGYRIINKGTGKVLDLQAAAQAEGAPVHQKPRNGGANQVWKRTSYGGGLYDFVSASSGKILGTQNANDCPDGLKAQQFTNSEGTNRRWYLVTQPDGSFKMYSTNCFKPLRAESSTDGATISLGPDSDSDNVKWIFEDVPTPIACASTPVLAGNDTVCLGGNLNLISSASTGTAQWTSSDNSIATVSSGGVVKGLKLGRTTITYKNTGGDCAGTVTKNITVSPALQTIDATVKDPQPTLGLNGSITFNNLPAGATTEVYQGRINPQNFLNIRTPSTKTTYEGLEAGDYTLILQYNSCQLVKYVTIKFVAPCQYNPSISGDSSVCVGSTLKLTGSPTIASVNWLSQNQDIAIVDQNTGVVTALSEGKATIVYIVDINNCSSTAKKIITVKNCTATGFSAAKCYTVKASGNDKFIEITNAEGGVGASARQNTFTGSRRQIWRIKPLEGGYYRFKNGKSGLTLEVANGSTSENARLQQNEKTLTQHQQFKFELASATSPIYRIIARHSGKYVSPENNSSSALARIVQESTTGGGNQQWLVSEVTCPSGTVELVSAQVYTLNGYQNGRQAVLNWVSNATNADYFTVEKRDKNGEFENLDHVNAKVLADEGENNYYTYTDKSVSEGENTYRITLHGDDTPPQYSNLFTVNFRPTQDVNIFPNPTSEYADIDLSSYENQAVDLRLMDAGGREVLFSKVEKAGKTERIDLEGLTTGQYILHIRTKGKRDVTRLLNITK
jgi:Ricin-type beta-trefoil lectin domain-like/Secretion system C-terminal sorting domain/Bacterial Ig-like domain (group 2)